MVRVTVIILLAAAMLGCSKSAKVSADFLERSVTVGGKEYRYRVLVPKNRDPNRQVPVMLFLHGSGARGDDNLAQVDGFHWSIEPIKDKVDFVAVLPQCKQDSFWAANDMATYALAALDSSVNEFNGDPQRLYLAGFSSGGYGVWQIAAAYPGKFAALMPVSGGVVGERPIEPEARAAIIPEVGTMLDSPEPYKAVAAAIAQTPVWAFHGDKDESVPVDFSRTIVAALKENGSKNVKYTEYANDGHYIINKVFSEPGLIEWLGEQRLDRVK